jgi:hypothetical protein
LIYDIKSDVFLLVIAYKYNHSQLLKPDGIITKKAGGVKQFSANTSGVAGSGRNNRP